MRLLPCALLAAVLVAQGGCQLSSLGRYYGPVLAGLPQDETLPLNIFHIQMTMPRIFHIQMRMPLVSQELSAARRLPYTSKAEAFGERKYSRPTPVAAGRREPPDAEIVGGRSASRGQFPHQASILMDDSFLCGGSLISASAVLTAGHCASGFSTWSVSLGGLQFRGTEAGKATIVTRSATVHPEYDADMLINDIAVVFLGSAVPFSSNIRPANLPSRSQTSNSFEGQLVTVSGWGRTSNNGNNPTILQYTTLNVVSNSLCAQYYGSSIVPSTLCASGSNRQGTCNGDSGGPMVISSQGSNTLIGVVSFVSGNGCESGEPSGYARVTSFLEWISITAGVHIP